MKILLVHNYYQVAGGEDSVFSNEKSLLEQNGNDVIVYIADNDSISNTLSKLSLVIDTIFSFSQYRKFMQVIKDESPDLVHVHNYFPLMSPAIFFACKKLGIPVVHTLHNFRAICPTGLLMHDGQINEQSIEGSSWWSVRKKVYKDSMPGTFVVACMIEIHKALGTWQTKVDRYISLTAFARNKYVQAGWPSEKLMVKPNFIEDPIDNSLPQTKLGGYGVYVGRISAEKGIDIILDAWADLDFPLKIVGDGPQKSLVENCQLESIEYLGLKSKDDVIELIKNADFLVMASTWYEGFPMVLVEAFACGTCAIVSNLGSMAEIVDDGETGLHFEPGNKLDLRKKIKWLLDNPDQSALMGEKARQQYLEKYTPEINYETLMGIYKSAQQN